MVENSFYYRFISVVAINTFITVSEKPKKILFTGPTEGYYIKDFLGKTNIWTFEFEHECIK